MTTSPQLKYKKVLWLEPPRYSGGLKRLMQSYIRRAGLNPLMFSSQCITVKCLKKVGKTKYTWDESRRKYFDLKLQQIDPDFIIINDKAALGYITSKYISTATMRGSVLRYEINGKQIPCIVIDDVFKVKSTTTGGWILLQDLGKLKRWLYGCQRHEPKFSYTVVKSLSDLERFKFAAQSAQFGSCDIETSGRGRNAIISCIGYTFLENNGKIHSWVIPFFNGTQRTGCQWANSDDEVAVWKAVKEVNSNRSIYKIFQNGTYDNTFLTRYRVPVCNYILDTMNMMHSIWPEARKNLAMISSLALDFYTYWKDEGKEEKDEKAESWAVPETEYGMENYWRYNALDCHYTLLSALFYLNLITNPKLSWALDNYEDEIAQVTGPAFAMSMRGVRVNQQIKNKLAQDNIETSEKELQILRTMVGDLEFNPNSTSQVPELIYDILNSQEIPRKGRSSNEQILKLVQTQGPLQDIIIDQIWKTKKPANNASKYGENLWLWNGRLLYKMNGTGTETWRYSSKSHDLWIGTQVQNIPYSIRPMIEADSGWVLFDIDYAQSDAYFTAFTLEEENFIKTMLSDDDTHCIHAAFFFKRNFEELVEAHKKKEAWCSHNVTGVRSITKRVVYGANYLMMGYTLFITMGKPSVIAAAEYLGYKNPSSWGYKELIQLCEKLLQSYFEMYPGLKPQLNLELQKAANNGNRFQCAFGKTRSFFGNLISDDKAMREFAAFIGQGGTAGNINKALRNIYYRDIEPKNPGQSMLLFQVHDSIIGQVKEDRLDLIPKIQQAMENKCTINGRTFTVPTEAQVGIGWGKRLMDYHKDITLNEIKSHDRDWMIKNGFKNIYCE